MSYTFRAIVGAQQFELPDWLQCSLGYDFSDVGVFSGEYAKDGVNSGQVVDRAIIVALWNGKENFDSRYVLSAGDDDDDVEAATKKVTGLSILDVFRRVIVEEIAAAPGQSLKFFNANAGGILTNLFTAAQARGALTGITWDFTNAVDSAGQPWALVIPDIEYKLGLKYLDLLRNLVDQGLIEVRFDGTKLQAFNADTMGTDRSVAGAGQVELKAGLDYTEMPRKWSSADRAKFSMTVGDEGSIVRKVDNTIPDGPFGREEMAVSQGGTKDVGTLTLVNDAALEKVKQTREQLTRKVIIREDGPIPGVDYRVSDYILERVVEEDGTSRSSRYRLRSMVVEVDGSGDLGAASIVLNDKFLEAEIRTARKVNGIIGGATADGGGNGVPVQDKPDTTVPGPPTGLVMDSSAYLDSNGVVRTLVQLDWVAPAQNTDGSAVSDLKEYEVQYRKAGEALWKAAPRVTTDYTVISNIDPEISFEARVRAWDNSSHSSAWSATVTGTTENDVIPPPVPSTPTAEVYLGAVLLTWDGKGVGGELMPDDFAGCRVHFSKVNDFDPAATNVSQTMLFKNRPGAIPVSGLEYGVPYFFKLVAFDRNGNASGPSGQVSATPRRVVETDIEPGAISTGVVNFDARDLGAQSVFFGPSAPPSPNADDLWIDESSNNQLKRWTGDAWVLVDDQRIATAITDSEQAAQDAQDAYNLASAKITVYFQASAPTGQLAADVNDLWIDSDDNQKVYRWTGSVWALTNIASTDYIASRATDLVTNGTGLLGNNTNFSTFTFDASDAPTGSAGSFYEPGTPAASGTVKYSDENMPVDPSKKYKLSLYARQRAAGIASKAYTGIAPYDGFKNVISPFNYMYRVGTTTTLAAPLNPGDTTVTLTSSANWKNVAGANQHWRTIIWWDYVDPAGKLWPAETYSRNYIPYAYADNAIVGNVITLSAPYAGPAKPAGTKLSNGGSGSNFMYAGIVGTVVPEAWTQFVGSDFFTSTHKQTGAAGSDPTAATFAFPPGTASVKLLFLTDRDVTGGKQAFAGLSFSDASAAQATADVKTVVFSQASMPLTTGRTNGDMWYDTDDGNQLYIWTGLAWTASDLGVQAVNFTARDIGAITTYWQASAPTGTLKIGDLWIDIDDTNKTYRWSGTQWDLAADQRIADAITAAAGAQATADGKVRTYAQDAAPTGTSEEPLATGDLWADTDDSNKLYRWSGAAWVAVDDARISAQAAEIAQLQDDLVDANLAIATARSIADGIVTTFYQASPPSGAAEGDVWVDTDASNASYRLDGAGAWQLITDTRVTDALNNAAAAAASADGKITSFYQASPPTSMTDSNAGDLWFDTDDGNKAYWYRSSTPGPAGWVAVPFGGNALQPGSISQTNLAGEIRAALGQVFYDDMSDTSRWENIVGGGQLTATSAADAVSGGYVGKATGAINQFWAHKTLIPFDANELYRVTVRVRENAASAPARFYAGVVGVAADGSTYVNSAGANSPTSQFYCAAAGVDVGGAWALYTGYISGTSVTPSGGMKTDPKDPAPLHQSVRYIRPLFVTNYTGTAGDVMDIDMVKVEAVPTGLVARQNIALAAINSALIEDAAIINAKIANLAVTDAKINDLAANKITTAELAAGVRVIAGPSSGFHAELTSTGFKAYGINPDGNLFEAVRMGTSTNDVFALSDSSGDTVASISDQGEASFSGMSVFGTDSDADGIPDTGAEIYGRDFTDWMWNKPWGSVAGAYSSDIFGGSVYTEYGIGEVSFTQIGGREYKVTFGGMVCWPAAATTRIVIRMRYTSDGTAPKVGTSQIGASCFKTYTTTYPQLMAQGLTMKGNFGPDGATIRVMVTLEGLNSLNVAYDCRYAGGVNHPFRLFVEDIGPEVPDTFIAQNGGGVYGPPGGAASAPITNAKKTYQSVWWATNSESYRGTNTARTDTSDLVQGYDPSGFNGDGHAVVVFGTTAASGETGKTIASALSGATLVKAEAYMYAKSWYYNSGGSAIVRPYNSTSLSSATPTGTARYSSSFPYPGGRWVDITSFATTAIRGFTLGKAASTNLIYYGRFYDHTASGTVKPKLRLTYTR